MLLENLQDIQKEEEDSDLKELLHLADRLKKGDEISVDGYEVKEGKTSPPKRYTSGSMVLAMENAGQLIEDEELREQIKGSGIGTSATRAEIIKKLVRIHYLNLNKRTQVLTPENLGEMVFEVVSMTVPALLNPKMTASWEKGLDGITQGTVDFWDYRTKLEDFIRIETEKMIGQDLREPLAERISNFAGKHARGAGARRKIGVRCPACGGELVTTPFGYGCANYKNDKSGCNFNIGEIAGVQLSEEQVKELIEQGHTPSASWSNDSTDHWKICENPWCGEIIEKSAHTYGGWTVTIPATEEHEGERQHTCTECGYTETEIISKEAHVHSFGSEWKHDGTYHWHECDCGERTDVSAHTPDGGRTAQSGGIYTGTLTYTCTVCGSVTGTERIKDNKTYNIPDYTFAPLYIETGITYEKLRIGVETDESSVTLSWNSIGGAKGYKVYVYDSDDALISVKKTDETTITFKKLTNGETYRFVVKYTLSGRSYLSNYSDEAKVTIMYKPFVKVSAGFGSVKLSWEAVEGAEKYAVYKINDGRAVKLTETTKLSVRISTSEEGIYGVKAYVNGKWTTLTTSDLVKAKAE